MTQELRCYTFTLAQLNTMQQGIQAAHAVVELMIKQDDEWVFAWAHQYKTMICLDGGDYTDMVALREFLASSDNPYPYAHFWEDESLARLHTSTAIILPERIFKTVEVLRKRTGDMPVDYPDAFGVWELELVDRISKARRAQ